MFLVQLWKFLFLKMVLCSNRNSSPQSVFSEDGMDNIDKKNFFLFSNLNGFVAFNTIRRMWLDKQTVNGELYV